MIAHSQILNLSRQNVLAISRTFWRHVLFHLGLLRNEPQRPLSPSLYSAHHYFTHLTLILIVITIVIIILILIIIIILIAIPINSHQTCWLKRYEIGILIFSRKYPAVLNI